MSSSQKNLSSFDPASVPDASGMRIGIVVSEWNQEVTEKLSAGAHETLLQYGCSKENIILKHVPGSYELPLGAMMLAEHGKVDAVICLGCVIQGETRHFEFICNAVSQGLINLSFRFGMPFIFGVLTTHSHPQAIDRAGGRHGNKGVEAAVTAIKMVAMKKAMEERK